MKDPGELCKDYLSWRTILLVSTLLESHTFRSHVATVSRWCQPTNKITSDNGNFLGKCFIFSSTSLFCCWYLKPKPNPLERTKPKQNDWECSARLNNCDRGMKLISWLISFFEWIELEILGSFSLVQLFAIFLFISDFAWMAYCRKEMKFFWYPWKEKKKSSSLRDKKYNKEIS